MMRISSAFLCCGLVLASCVPPPDPAPTPAPAPSPQPVIVAPVAPTRPAGDWNDWPFSVGDWSYRRDATGPVAAFGTAGAPLITLRCDVASRRMKLVREGAASQGTLTIRTTALTKSFAGNQPSPSAALTADIAASDPILDAMAFSRGRIAIEANGAQPIAVPPWAEITRIVEDCRG